MIFFLFVVRFLGVRAPDTTSPPLKTETVGPIHDSYRPLESSDEDQLKRFVEHTHTHTCLALIWKNESIRVCSWNGDTLQQRL